MAQEEKGSSHTYSDKTYKRLVKTSEIDGVFENEERKVREGAMRFNTSLIAGQHVSDAENNRPRLSDAPEKEVTFLKRAGAIGAFVLVLLSGWGIKEQLESGPEINRDNVERLYNQKRLVPALIEGDEDIVYNVKSGDRIWSLGDALLEDEEDVRKFVQDVQQERKQAGLDPSMIHEGDRISLPEDVEDKIQPVIEELDQNN